MNGVNWNAEVSVLTMAEELNAENQRLRDEIEHVKSVNESLKASRRELLEAMLASGRSFCAEIASLKEIVSQLETSVTVLADPSSDPVDALTARVRGLALAHDITQTITH